MTSPVTDARVYSDLSGLAALKREARAQDPNAVREVAKQFESIFAKMVLSSMRQASFGDSLMGSQQQEFYQGMFDDQLAVELTKGRGLGLADMLVRQLSQAGLVPGEAAEGASGGSVQRTGNEGLPFGRAGNAERSAGIPFAASSGLKSASLPTQAGSRLAGSAQAGSPLATSADEFVRELWPCAEQAGKELGVDPRHLLAQAALETGWGKSLPCDVNGNTSFNLFGIKAGDSWSGPSVSVRTLEFEGGVPIPKQAKFRSYDSAAESFRDYVALLRDNPRYAGALNTGSDADAFASALQRGGYATDPAYAKKITAIAQNLGAHAPAPAAAHAAARAPISETALKSSAEVPINNTLATL